MPPVLTSAQSVSDVVLLHARVCVQSKESQDEAKVRREEEMQKSEEAFNAWKMAKDAELAKLRMARGGARASDAPPPPTSSSSSSSTSRQQRPQSASATTGRRPKSASGTTGIDPAEKTALFDDWLAAKKAEERQRRDEEKQSRECVIHLFSSAMFRTSSGV
jgi:hypothetical protein